MGILKGIGYKLEKRGAIITVDRAFVGLQTGVAQDVRGLPGKRQVTVMALESFDTACDELQTELPWTTRRANLLVEGIDLLHTTGKTVKIGSVVLEITGETEPCFRMDEQCEGLKEALKPDWRGGVLCKVVSEGDIAVGDVVTID